MSANFGDPAFEPTDEQLHELSREAFAEVASQCQAAQAEMRTRIHRLRLEAIARLARYASSIGITVPPA